MINLHAGRRLHYLVGSTIVVAILVGLCSSVAMAGRAPRTARAMASEAVQQAALDASPAAPELPELRLEDDPAFAPTFQTVAARARPAQRRSLKAFVCALASPGACARAGRLHG